MKLCTYFKKAVKLFIEPKKYFSGYLFFSALNIFLFINPVQAKVRVIFLEIRNYDGELVQLEPNGQYAHVAISYKNHWLHSHPYRGVEMVTLDKVLQVGLPKKMIELSHLEELDLLSVQNILGKPFDHGYLWDDEKIYCAELVGKLLNLKPTPMFFDPNTWPKQYQKLNGLPGMSPDDIFESLSKTNSVTDFL